jgi:peptidoglycan hydrolase CwlO-like protein
MDDSDDKEYVRSCKEIIKKQSEQLKTQQKDFRSTVAQLETQQFTARFHAVAFKIELVLARVFETLSVK